MKARTHQRLRRLSALMVAMVIAMPAWITVFAAGEASVGTADEFIAALNNSSISKIALTQDIVIPEKKSIVHAKRTNAGSVVIDGRKSDSERYKLITERSVPWLTGGSIKFDTGFTNVTFQNIVLKSGAFDGMFDTLKAINFTFDNVCFTGPALLRMEKNGGNVTLKNSRFTLQGRDTQTKLYTYPSELIEMFDGTILLTGDINVYKNAAPDSLDHDEVFYFRHKATKLVIDEGANVAIYNYSTAVNSLFYSGLIFADSDNSDHEFIIKDNARFYFETEGGIITEQWPIRNFTVGKGANASMSVNVPGTKSKLTSEDMGVYFRARNITLGEGSNWAVTVHGNAVGEREAVVGVNNLTVDQGASMLVKTDDKLANDLVRMYSKNSVVTLNNPRQVMFYHGDRAVSPTSAFAGNKGATDGWGNDGATNEITVRFTGYGVRAWNAGAPSLGINDDWSIPEAAKPVVSWGTDPSRPFTIEFKVDKTGKLTSEKIIGNSANLANVGKFMDAIKTFADRSVVEFNGGSMQPAITPTEAPTITATETPAPTPMETLAPTPTETPTPTEAPDPDETPIPPEDDRGNGDHM